MEPASQTARRPAGVSRNRGKIRKKKAGGFIIGVGVLVKFFSSPQVYKERKKREKKQGGYIVGVGIFFFSSKDVERAIPFQEQRIGGGLQVGIL